MKILRIVHEMGSVGWYPVRVAIIDSYNWLSVRSLIGLIGQTMNMAF